MCNRRSMNNNICRIFIYAFNKLPEIRIKMSKSGPLRSIEEIINDTRIHPTLGAFWYIFEALRTERELAPYIELLGGVDSWVFITLADDAFFIGALKNLRNAAAHRQPIGEEGIRNFHTLTFEKKYITKLNERINKIRKKL